jgi:hypothetical protein
MTACKDCKHLIIDDNMWNEAEPRWYYMLCHASPRPKAFNPFTGKIEIDEIRYEYCRNINRGDCPKFEAKGTL